MTRKIKKKGEKSTWYAYRGYNHKKSELTAACAQSGLENFNTVEEMRKALKILAGSTNPSEETIQKINGTYQNNRREYQLFIGQTECVNLSSMVTITCRPPVCPRSTPSTTTVFKSANTVLLVVRAQRRPNKVLLSLQWAE
ncbi:hypothetical protein GQX74_012785 [Glossina fuscipes]|nr:hypothetical protein GQX74_012785 [Glossina fuscipes]